MLRVSLERVWLGCEEVAVGSLGGRFSGREVGQDFPRNMDEGISITYLFPAKKLQVQRLKSSEGELLVFSSLKSRKVWDMLITCTVVKSTGLFCLDRGKPLLT